MSTYAEILARGSMKTVCGFDSMDTRNNAGVCLRISGLGSVSFFSCLLEERAASVGLNAFHPIAAKMKNKKKKIRARHSNEAQESPEVIKLIHAVVDVFQVPIHIWPGIHRRSNRGRICRRWRLNKGPKVSIYVQHSIVHRKGPHRQTPQFV